MIAPQIIDYQAKRRRAITPDLKAIFGDLRSLLSALGFAARVRGDHHIFSRPGIEEILKPAAAWFGGQARSTEIGSRPHRSA